MGIEQSAFAAWTFSTAATTGGLKAVKIGPIADRYTVLYEAGPGSSAVVRMETTMGSSAGTYVTIPGTSTTVSTSVSIQQFAGPLDWIRPYSPTRSTGALTVTLRGN